MSNCASFFEISINRWNARSMNVKKCLSGERLKKREFIIYYSLFEMFLLWFSHYLELFYLLILQIVVFCVAAKDLLQKRRACLTLPTWREIKYFYNAVLRSLTLKSIIVCLQTPNNTLAVANDHKLIIQCTQNTFRHSPKSNFTLYGFTRNFEATPENPHFLYF